MILRKSRTLTVVGLIVGILVWWFFPQKKNPPAAGTLERKAAVPVAAEVSMPGVSAGAETLPEFGTEAFNQMVLSRGAAWVASRNRDATSLMALYDLTGEASLLEEMVRNFPDNPQVCLAKLNQLMNGGGSREEKQEWTAKLIKADPENPLGYHYLAALSAEKGDLPGVMAALETALSKPGRLNSWERDHMLAAKEGLLAGGADFKDAGWLAVAGPMNRGSSGLGASPANRMARFFKDQMNALRASGNVIEVQRIAELGLRSAEQTRISQAPTLITELIARGQKSMFLSYMDPTTEIVNTGRTVAEEITEMEKQNADLKPVLDVGDKLTPFLEESPKEITSRYWDLVILDGELSARKWLLGKMNEQKP